MEKTENTNKIDLFLAELKKHLSSNNGWSMTSEKKVNNKTFTFKNEKNETMVSFIFFPNISHAYCSFVFLEDEDTHSISSSDVIGISTLLYDYFSSYSKFSFNFRTPIHVDLSYKTKNKIDYFLFSLFNKEEFYFTKGANIFFERIPFKDKSLDDLLFLKKSLQLYEMFKREFYILTASIDFNSSFFSFSFGSMNITYRLKRFGTSFFEIDSRKKETFKLCIFYEILGFEDVKQLLDNLLISLKLKNPIHLFGQMINDLCFCAFSNQSEALSLSPIEQTFYDDLKNKNIILNDSLVSDETKIALIKCFIRDYDNNHILDFFSNLRNHQIPNVSLVSLKETSKNSFELILKCNKSKFSIGVSPSLICLFTRFCV